MIIYLYIHRFFFFSSRVSLINQRLLISKGFIFQLIASCTCFILIYHNYLILFFENSYIALVKREHFCNIVKYSIKKTKTTPTSRFYEEAYVLRMRKRGRILASRISSYVERPDVFSQCVLYLLMLICTSRKRDRACNNSASPYVCPEVY